MRLNEQVEKLDAAVQMAAEDNPQARLLMTRRGWFRTRRWAYMLTMGDVRRLRRGKQVATGTHFSLWESKNVNRMEDGPRPN